jgi:hypothetical protein
MINVKRFVSPGDDRLADLAAVTMAASFRDREASYGQFHERRRPRFRRRGEVRVGRWRLR